MQTVESPTRITLALDIIRRLSEGPYAGYHEMGIVKHRIDLADTVSVVESAQDRIECDQADVPDGPDNICLKAVELLRQRFHIQSQVTVSIVKRIPVKGGLAGGSADAAAVLLLLNKLWRLGLDLTALADIGRGAGMDVPYFFSGPTAFDTESTGRCIPVKTALTFDFVLVIPAFGISTADAYRDIDYSQIGASRRDTETMIDALQRGDRSTVTSLVHNDFAHSVFRRHPELGVIRQRLLDLGCEQAFMSGSGSTIVGIATDRCEALRIVAEFGTYPYIRDVLASRSFTE